MDASESPFHFDRYINGVLMAEGVTIERQSTLAGAMREAARLASKGPNNEAPVLVLRSPLAPVVAIKPLVWSPVEAWRQCSRERAPAFGGEYQIVMLDPDRNALPSLYFEIGLGAFMFRFEQAQDPMGFPGETCPRKFPSIDAAKAAAQADFERRILSALVEPRP